MLSIGLHARDPAKRDGELGGEARDGVHGRIRP